MSVMWYWAEGYERIAVIEYAGKWTWEDNDIILGALVKQIKKRGYEKIDVISYLKPDVVMPGPIYERGRTDAEQNQEYISLVVFVGMRDVTQEAYQQSRENIKNNNPYPYQFADTVERALQIIVGNRQYRKRTGKE